MNKRKMRNSVRSIAILLLVPVLALNLIVLAFCGCSVKARASEMKMACCSSGAAVATGVSLSNQPCCKMGEATTASQVPIAATKLAEKKEGQNQLPRTSLEGTSTAAPALSTRSIFGVSQFYEIPPLIPQPKIYRLVSSYLI